MNKFGYIIQFQELHSDARDFRVEASLQKRLDSIAKPAPRAHTGRLFFTRLITRDGRSRPKKPAPSAMLEPPFRVEGNPLDVKLRANPEQNPERKVRQNHRL